MSRIVNTNFSKVYGVATHSDMNKKFSDIVTATATINEANVRSEGIDRRNLSTLAIIKEIEYTTNNAVGPTTYTQDGTATFKIDHDDDVEISFGATGITLKAGDLVRVHFNCCLDTTEFELTTSTASWALMVFPAWDITSNALTDYQMLPDEVDLFCAAPSDPYPYGIAGGFDPTNNGNTNSIVTIPLIGYNNGVDFTAYRNEHGSFIYQHAGADLQVYGIRLYGRGPLYYGHHGTPLADGRAFVYEPSALGVTFDLHISNAQLGFIVMQKGSM